MAVGPHRSDLDRAERGIASGSFLPRAPPSGDRAALFRALPKKALGAAAPGSISGHGPLEFSSSALVKAAAVLLADCFPHDTQGPMRRGAPSKASGDPICFHPWHRLRPLGNLMLSVNDA